MTEQQFKELLEKYERGTATAYEARQVEEFFKSYIEEALDEGLPVMGSAEERKTALLNRITLPTRRMMAPQRSSTMWWAAAASVVMALACFLFVYPWQEPVSGPVAEAKIVPGSDKAILQLSDNSIVTLDSANQQRILQQGASLVTGGGGKLVYNKQDESAEPVYNKVITPRGGQYELVLSDGTRVWLNASSSLRFPVAFVGNERVVELTGEAYFEVAKDADRIFRVIAPNQDVEVLGTSFNVMAYADEPMIRTSLIEGVVNIIPASGKEKAVQLRPGQQSQLDTEGNLQVVTDGAIIDQAVAWRFGMFQFDNTEMKVVMRQVSRWYDVDVAYEEGVEDLELVGVVSRKSSLSSVLRVMELTGAVHFEVRPDVIIVKPGRKPGT